MTPNKGGTCVGGRLAAKHVLLHLHQHLGTAPCKRQPHEFSQPTSPAQGQQLGMGQAMDTPRPETGRPDGTPSAQRPDAQAIPAKAESAALYQARTEKIRLRAFLFRLGIPGIASPACPCRQGDQTAAHLFAECTDIKSRAMRAMGFSTVGEVWEGLSDHRKAPGMARALVKSGWLPQFRVFNEIRLHDGTAAEEESAWARRLLPGQARRRGRRRNPAM